VRVKMSRTTRFVGAAVLPQQADPPAGGRHFRVGPKAAFRAAKKLERLFFAGDQTQLEAWTGPDFCEKCSKEMAREIAEESHKAWYIKRGLIPPRRPEEAGNFLPAPAALTTVRASHQGMTLPLSGTPVIHAYCGSARRGVGPAPPARGSHPHPSEP
jgi:hypothetical protein